MTAFTAVLFDLDGTLVRSAGEIAEALDRTFDEWRLPHLRLAEVEALVGRGVRALVERALARAGATSVDVDLAVERFGVHYDETLGTSARLFHGVAEGLRMLEAADIAMGVVTNKPRLFTERLLRAVQIDRFFAAIVAGDDGIAKKPSGDMVIATCAALATEPARTLMIGDSENDVVAARMAGCPVWCVPYGYNEGRAVETLECDRIVATVAEAARLVTGSPPARG